MKLHKLITLTGLSMIFGLAAVLTVSGTAQTPFVLRAAEEEEEEEEEEPLAVSMSKESGIYSAEFTLALESEGATAIYYTLDGSNPATSDTRMFYEDGITITDRAEDENVVSAVDPILFDSANVSWDADQKKYVSKKKAPDKERVDKGTVVKAVAVDAEGKAGTVETNTYFVGTVADHIQGAKESANAAGIPLSVVSISMDYDDLFDYETGIYIKGKIYDDALNAYLENRNNPGDARNFPANYSQKGREWEREAHIDYFETDGTELECKLQQDCGIRIQGNYSRSDLMKGLRLYARAEYGKKNFKYPFFENAKDDNGETIEKYKKLVLRNGGNYAFSGTKYNDTYWQSMLTELDCETQASRACVVYIDGEYWGLYILQQDYDDNYFEVTHGVDKDNVIVYKASDADVDKEYGYKLDEGDLPEGVEDVNYYYSDLLAFFKEHKDLSSEEDYQEFCKLVDPQSVMDYFAVNVWINNKWDWPGKNWSMWRTTVKEDGNEYADGRFRFCFYDLDFGGCGGSGEVYDNTIRDDNYYTELDDGVKKGLLGPNLKEPMNPAVQCFILLMSNEGFRESYIEELTGLQDTVFARDIAVAKLDQFRDVYNPLFEQFYKRYSWSNDYTGGYAGYQSLKDFVTNRSKGIPNNVNFIHEHYKRYSGSQPQTSPAPDPSADPGISPAPGDPGSPSPGPETPDSPQPTQTPGNDDNSDETTKKTINKLTVTAKKNKRTIQVKTIAKAKVTVTLSKKMIVKGKKKVKRITVTTSKKGAVKLNLSGKLTKGIKVKVTVKKSGYQTKSKTVKVH